MGLGGWVFFPRVTLGFGSRIELCLVWEWEYAVRVHAKPISALRNESKS